MNIANYFTINATTNLIDSEGDHGSSHAHFTTNNWIKARSIFEDQCAKHEHVAFFSYYVTAENRDDPDLVNTQYGGLS